MLCIRVFNKLIFSSIQIPNILVLTVRFKFINFVFQISSLFILEMPGGFTYYVVEMIPIYLVWIT
jgi:hypothetical protein